MNKRYLNRDGALIELDDSQYRAHSLLECSCTELGFGWGKGAESYEALEIIRDAQLLESAGYKNVWDEVAYLVRTRSYAAGHNLGVPPSEQKEKDGITELLSRVEELSNHLDHQEYFEYVNTVTGVKEKIKGMYISQALENLKNLNTKKPEDLEKKVNLN